MPSRTASRLRQRIAASTRRLFAHAPYPLDESLSYPGDPGLFGPDSATWRVIGDPAAFIGGVRALLVQAAHPEVAAGVFDHSRYREDPLGRLSRTSAYVTATAFGAMPEVERAVLAVRRAHRPVQGVSHRERAYSADAPELAAWVHNALTDSFLEAYLRFGPFRRPAGLADRFAAEQVRLGVLLDADPIPASAADLARWIEDHEALAVSPGMGEAIAFLRSPPLPWAVRPAYRLLFVAAAATLPRRIRRLLGLRRRPGAILVGRMMTGFLRWALGSSPSWQLALVRVGAEIPPGRFRQPLPVSVDAVA
jgi:uncharacterized protein (DUF2236 family)